MANTPVPPMPVLPYPPAERPFRYFCQMALPAVYTDELSYYELLCKVVEQLNRLITSNNQLNEDMQALYDFVKKLRDLMDEFVNSGFDDYYKDQVIAWIDSHLTMIFTNLVRQVYFGLTLEGYFVAYVPDGWSDIVFDTGADYTLDTYGRLILRWDADSPYTVDQTPEKLRS